MREIISDFEVYETDRRTMNLTITEGFRWRLEMLSHETLALQTTGELNQEECYALECLLKSYSTLCELVENLERFEWSQASEANLSLVSHGTAGRPSFDISFSLLKTLLEDGFLYLVLLVFWGSPLVPLDNECLLFICLSVKCIPPYLRMNC